MNEIQQTSAIAQQNSVLDLFSEIPDYAIDALWLEWERVKRRNPPANMICTTIAAYQAFCKIVNDQRGDFPSVFVSQDFLCAGVWNVKKSQQKRVDAIAAQWDESDRATYVAFIYTGREHLSIAEALIKKLKPQTERIQASRQAE